MVGSRGLPKELREAGAVRRQAPVPESIDREWLAERCEHYEDVLRLQYDDEELPPADERALSAPERDPSTTGGALRRFVYLKHCYIKRERNLQASSAGQAKSEDQMRALVELLRAEPVTVQLSSRNVEVTDRSYSCLREIGRHAQRISALDQDLDRIRDLQGRVRERMDKGVASRYLERRLAYLKDLEGAAQEERENHRRAILAHLTTEDGAPADSLEEAPEWADEVGPIDELALIMGVRRAMKERVDRLGPRPEHPRDGDREALEDWGIPGWLIPMRDFDGQTPVDAASYLDQRLGRRMAEERANPPTVSLDESGSGEPRDL